jgi:hypothetical protein
MKSILILLLVIVSNNAVAQEKQVMLNCQFRTDIYGQYNGTIKVVRESDNGKYRYWMTETIDGAVIYDGHTLPTIGPNEDYIWLAMPDNYFWSLSVPGESGYFYYYANKFKDNLGVGWSGSCQKYDRFSN